MEAKQFSLLSNYIGVDPFKLVKNTNPDKYKCSGYGLGFEVW